ncbi:alpha/beta hydrolase family protein [Lyticum sinuosum]|uniref:S9 family peptidase n=1 Tax=Lyticum sinuosum TaxID=1332059 RepID=A0AAE4VL43_9RICK|nr:S9 family peptidase [Lyticum sinuosum]MDZ5761384.1 S9 family peptidase [Lyticum sinuosum]
MKKIILRKKLKTIIIVLLLILSIIFGLNYLFNNFNEKNIKISTKNIKKMNYNSYIPRNIIFDNPEFSGLSISPNGDYLSYSAPYNKVMNIYVISVDKFSDLEKTYNSLESKENRKSWMSDLIKNSKIITKSTDRPIINYFWTEDSKYIVYLLDKDGDENHGMYFFDPHSGEEVFRIVEPGVKFNPLLNSKKYPNILLFASNGRRKDLFDIYKLDTKKWEKELLITNDKYSNFIFDDDLNLRFGDFSLSNGGIQVDIFKFSSLKDHQQLKESDTFVADGIIVNNKNHFNKIKNDNIENSSNSLLNNDNLYVYIEKFMTILPENVYTTNLIGFNKDNTKVYILDSFGQNTPSIYIEDINTRKRETLFYDKKSDDISISIDENTKELRWIDVNYARNKRYIFDTKIKDDFLKLEQSFPNTEISIISSTIDDRNWIISVWSDTIPSEFYLYDRNQESIKFIATTRPKLWDYKLMPMYPVLIESRDNLNMISYLTLPEESNFSEKIIYNDDKIAINIHPKNPVPLILYVHGGPTARDDWGLNPVTQWLANRGYAVLNVNYRGSTGFGKEFINAGNAEWGAKMHDDLIDAVEWAINNNITTRDKVGIFGGSYGGYAALVGLTFTPEVFACGVDIVGPSNLLTLMDSIPPYWKPFFEQLKIKIGGDPSTEEGKKFLAQRSPITFASNIKRPLLIGHGANDPRVKEHESEQMISELQRKNIPATYVLYPDEGHGFAKPENKMSFFAITEKFLANCFGNRNNFEEIKDEELNLSSAKFIAGKEQILKK